MRFKEAFAPLLAVGLLSSEVSFSENTYIRLRGKNTELTQHHMRYNAYSRASDSSVYRENATRTHVEASAFDELILLTAATTRVDPALLKAVIHAESAFDQDAVSNKGASGLMQLMPQTARRYRVIRIFDPKDNIRGGAHYLRELLNLFSGDKSLALAAYNAGENTVARYNAIPPYTETRLYVQKVLKLHKRYRREFCSNSNPAPGCEEDATSQSYIVRNSSLVNSRNQYFRYRVE